MWEHWCTLRNIRRDAPIGSSVLTAYVTLVRVLGDGFVAAVARGRTDYEHPRQLAAMIHGGFLCEEPALCSSRPVCLPNDAEQAFLTGSDIRAFNVARRLIWGQHPSCYMFARSIDRWADRNTIVAELADLRARLL